MKWRKLGHVWRPAGDRRWARTHAYVPTPTVHDDDIRVYVACLDGERIGRLAYVDVDRRDPRRVLRVASAPALDLGESGAFDEIGVSPSCVLDVEGERWLYYMGWQRAPRLPYLIFAGAARELRDGTFERVSRTPLLGPTADEPCIRSAITILPGSTGYRGWYVSATAWIAVAGRTLPTYVIRSATSPDGRVWTVLPGMAIGHESRDEFGLGRPWVIRDPALHRMWYSIRSVSAPYRIGYAESRDGGTSWIRKDTESGIERSSDGWDSEMICFPAIIDVDGRRFLFYNGNGHGATGFGVAELESG